ncbi:MULTISPECIES: methyltransferase [unclassified Streptomyces]|uniref:methyltransferase n=1 Tax=unclassified Streptomyces TaxID=2593676 RepID=UPI00225C0DA0|nr:MULTISPECIES: methyltransferase [unclassified Streptomyces]MCX5329080.1 acetylserotonin O-methyltransferase [Streptomyces sp. NBC_00140]MCX5358493.1 acetylserotonin O-methyltransferase [Streptomyces sp. NBC_00124]
MNLPVAQACLSASDLKRIERAAAHVRDYDTEQVLAELLPGLTAEERGDVCRHLVFDHTAVLVFPASLDGLCDDLRRHGFEPGPVAPSVVVRERLVRRYGALVGDAPVGIVHVPVDGRSVEIFALPVAPDSPRQSVADDERTAEHEVHHAFAVTAPGAVVPAGLRTLLQERGGAVPDGGGYNGHENVTVLYFRTGQHRRFELRLPGRHEPLPDPSVSLLGVMTGAWATQAVAAMAELGIADHLADRPGLGADALADLTGTDPDALRRLLRYLSALGLLTSAADTYHLTALGQPLCTATEFSLRPLAQLYGGPFYDSFAGLTYSVRTGREAFAHRYGQHHFTYFAERPELGTLFNRAMAASAEMFTPVADLVDFSGARRVVDVGGGNGALLTRVLRAHGHLEGVLLERPKALEAARKELAAVGLDRRCSFVVGDFTVAVPEGGDVYLLSRVLHDWDDERCLTILRRCAQAMRAGTELLVVERLLPQGEGVPSPAVAWDVHMLCNVGGRERTEDHYARLLAEAGFEVAACHGLPLGGSLIHAVRGAGM